MDNLISANVLQRIRETEDERRAAIRDAWNAYDGEMKQPLVVKFGEPDDNVIFPFVATFVNTGVNFLFGRDIEMTSDDERVTALIDAAWGGGYKAGERQGLTLANIATNGAIAGHTFVKLAPISRNYCRIIVLDPSNMSVTWDQEDFEKVTRYRYEWTTVQTDSSGRPTTAVRRQDTVRAENDASWEVIDSISAGADGTFREIGRSTWPYPFAPIVDTQNLPAPNEFWGRGDLDGGLLAINNSLNSVISDVRKILRYHASPTTVVHGQDSENPLNTGPASVVYMPEPEQSIERVEMKGDLGSSLETYKTLKEALHSLASIPEVATGKVDNIGNLSARAMQILYRPIVDQTQTKRRTYGHLINETNRRILQISGLDANLAPAIAWPEILPVDAAEERDALESDLRMGVVSKATVAAKLGYDYEQEAEKIATEGQSAADAILTAFDAGNTQGSTAYGQTGAEPVS